MDGKKDPGKFTVRFNIADPQQRAAAEMLNRQGRCKAQFITNAVLYYICAMPDGQAIFPLNGAAVQRTVMDGLSRHEDARPTKEAPKNVFPATDENENMEDTDMASIRKTMEAFQSIEKICP